MFGRPLGLDQVTADEVVDGRQAGRDRVADRTALYRRQPQGRQALRQAAHADFRVEDDVGVHPLQQRDGPVEVARQMMEFVGVFPHLLGHLVLALTEMNAGDAELRAIEILHPPPFHAPIGVAPDEGGDKDDPVPVIVVGRWRLGAIPVTIVLDIRQFVQHRAVNLLQRAVVVSALIGQQIGCQIGGQQARSVARIPIRSRQTARQRPQAVRVVPAPLRDLLARAIDRHQRVDAV